MAVTRRSHNGRHELRGGRATVDELQQCASDPNCRNADECRLLLTERDAHLKELDEAERLRREAVRAELQENPFDPRKEVSADAKQIVKHLWIIFVVLPSIWVILYEITK